MANDQYKQFNCYVVLEISFDATPGEIKAAMRRASLKSHPDLGGSHSEQAKINIAYEILSDPIQRQVHDIFWKVREKRGNTSQQTHRDRERQSNNKRSANSAKASTQSFTGFMRRVDAAIQVQKANAWGDLEAIKKRKIEQLLKKIDGERTTFYTMGAIGTIIGALAFRYPLLWPVAAVLAFSSFSKFNGVNIGDQRAALFASDLHQKIEQQAHQLVAKECNDKASSFDRYNSDLASIVELTTRPSSFDDSEIQVARRLTVALFLSGYNPSYYDGETRTILFSDKDEKLLVRFRHRSGAAVNAAYVEKLCQLMVFHQASNGLIFCSPGLSGNAAGLATRQRIKSYTLESMNSWIDEILKSDRVGPTGDVLASLDALRNFISGVAPRINRWSRRGRRY
jgi:curved DNA-binding protein CbpA